MHTSMEGNKFTVSLTVTRFKAAVILVIASVIFWWPYRLLNQSNEKIALLEQDKKTIVLPNIDIKHPIVSPYALPSESKRILNEWLLYGMNNGHEKMLQKYSESTNGKDNYKPFLYLIETEWRLGHWESVKP